MAEIFTDLAAEIVAELDYEFETNLIEAVKCHRCLYATDHPDYENMQQNKIAWLKISSCLGKTVTECMNKWYALLQIFLHYFKSESNSVTVTPPIVWAHYQAIKEMQPYLAENYSELIQLKPPFLYGKPTNAQRDALFKELETHHDQLMGVHSTMEQRQQFWLQASEKLNAMQPGAKMPIIKWQKYWWDMKQAVGVQRSWIQMKLKSMGTKIEVSKFSEEDMRILKFCGTTPSDTPACINARLSSNVEFGCNTDQIVRRCKKCTLVLNDLIVHEYCDTCRKIPKTLCDICSKRHEEHLLVYQLRNWSTHAKNLLPSSFYSYAELSICTVCANDLKKQASISWMACRICENYNQNLENLFSSANDHLRKVFRNATNIEFSESDGLPGYICRICKVQMQQFNNFYLRFSRAQIRLREIHSEKFVGVGPGKQSLKKKPVGSIISHNQVMILKPGGDASNGEIAGTQQNYTLQPRPEQEVVTTTNIATTSTTQSIGPLPSGSVTGHIYPKSTVIKRICTCKGGPEKEMSLVTNAGAVVARRIGAMPIAPAKINSAVQPGATLVGKGICALHPGSAPPGKLNVGSNAAIQGCAPTKTLTTQSNIGTLFASALKNPTSGLTQGIRAVKPVSSSVTMPTNMGSTIPKRTYAAAIKKIVEPAPVSGAPVSGAPVLPQGPEPGPTKELSQFPPRPTPMPINTAVTKASGSINTVSTKANSPFPPGLPLVPINNGVTKGNSTLTPGPPLASPLSAKTGTTVGKRIQTSQPAVFTISPLEVDYETQTNSPPIFCIPRSGSQLKTTNDKTNSIPAVKSSAPTDTTASTLIQATIKTEKVDDGYPLGQSLSSSKPNYNEAPSNSEARPDSEISSNASTVSIESTNIPSAHKDISPKRMRLVRLDGSTVVFNPSPSATCNLPPNVRSACPTFQSTFAAANCSPIQPKKGLKGRLTPSNPQKTFSGRKPQEYPIAIEEQQRQQQQQSTTGNKRVRKYWGAVDEFQITPQTSKTNSNNPPPLKQRRMTIHNLSPWSAGSPLRGSPIPSSNSQGNTSLPFGKIPVDAIVKKENEQLANSDLNPSMFYPDSFELGNVSLGTDVSSMINRMLTKDEEIDDNMKSFEYINPSFLASYVKDHDLLKIVEESKKEGPQMVESKEDKLPREVSKENKHKENKSEDVKPGIRMPIKKLRIKLKRNTELIKLASRLKNPSPPQLVITRKSLRRSNVVKDSNPST